MKKTKKALFYADGQNDPRVVDLARALHRAGFEIFTSGDVTAFIGNTPGLRVSSLGRLELQPLYVGLTAEGDPLASLEGLHRFDLLYVDPDAEPWHESCEATRVNAEALLGWALHGRRFVVVGPEDCPVIAAWIGAGGDVDALDDEQRQAMTAQALIVRGIMALEALGAARIQAPRPQTLVRLDLSQVFEPDVPAAVAH